MRTVTLREACGMLGGISYHTLRKWLGRLDIEPVRHERDWRFYCLTIDQVEAIRAARAEMPGNTSTKPSPIRAVGGLPDGLVSWRAFAKVHAIPEMTVQKAVASGRLPVVRGRWKVPRNYVEAALDADGRRAFVALWGHRPKFARCPDCLPGNATLRPLDHN